MDFKFLKKSAKAKNTKVAKAKLQSVDKNVTPIGQHKKANQVATCRDMVPGFFPLVWPA